LGANGLQPEIKYEKYLTSEWEEDMEQGG